jgi:hypothetical protein
MWQARLRHVLNTVWDPIGGCPADEYDIYLGQLTILVKDGASDQELADYLTGVVVQRMGLSDNPAATAETVAAIRKLGLLAS